MTKQTIEALVEGGNASGGPPLGPALGPTGINIKQVVSAINEKTKDMAGMKLPVKVIIDSSTKEFEIEVGSPPTSALIKKELNLEKGTGDGSTVGNLSFEQLLKITRMKMSSLLADDLTGAAKEVLGVCQTLGVTIEEKSVRVITAEISDGKLDDRLKADPQAAQEPAAKEKAEEPKPEEKKEEPKPEEKAEENPAEKTEEAKAGK